MKIHKRDLALVTPVGTAVPALDISPVGAFSTRAAWEEAVWDTLLSYVAKQNRAEPISKLLRVVLTPAERKDVVLRAAAIARIQAGMSYKEIGRELWISPQTISVVKKALHESSYRSYNERGKTERAKRIVGSILPPRKPYRRRVRTKYGTKEMRLL